MLIKCLFSFFLKHPLYWSNYSKGLEDTAMSEVALPIKRAWSFSGCLPRRVILAHVPSCSLRPYQPITVELYPPKLCAWVHQFHNFKFEVGFFCFPQIYILMSVKDQFWLVFFVIFDLDLDHNLFPCSSIMKMMSKMDSPHHNTHNMRYCTYFYVANGSKIYIFNMAPGGHL